MSSVNSSIDPGVECLSHGRGAARDVNTVCRLPSHTPVCRRRRSRSVTKWKVVPPSISIGSRGVVGEHEDRRVVRRLGAPPAAPVVVPGAADRAEHVAAHDVGAARAHEPGARCLVSLVGARIAEVPAVELVSALAQRVLAALL